MSPGSLNEKTETVTATDEQPTKKGSFFSRRKHQEQIHEDEKDGADGEATQVDTSASIAVPPVGFIELFRYVRVDRLLALCNVNSSHVASLLASS